MIRLLAALFLLTSSAALAERVAWPDLAKVCHVKGRAASEGDIKKGCAAFLLQSNGRYVGRPIKLLIPQYAFHIEDGTGKRTPVVVIQAEEGQGLQAVGYRVVGSDELGVSLLTELQLLGTKRPK